MTFLKLKKQTKDLCCLALCLLLALTLPTTVAPAQAAEELAIDETNFPDAIFRAYVSEECDADGNGWLSESEIAAVTIIDCGLKTISSMKGIEHFTALEVLSCWRCKQLTSLDVSKNTALTELDCSDNQLTSLDVSHNPALIFLRCSDNQLTSLDVSENPALVELRCEDNQLTSLNLSRNPVLKYFGSLSNVGVKRM